MQPTLRAARRFTRLAVWAPREFIASSPGAFDTLITKHSRHIFRVFLHLRVFFLSILASTVFGSQIEFANACVCKCLELANRYEREASVVLTDHKSADLIGALDDFNVEMRKNFCKRFRKLWSLISAVGEHRLQKWKHAEQRRHHENAAIAILNVGRMNDGVEQETYCVDKNVPLLALDLSATSSLSLLARIVAVRINARPPPPAQRPDRRTS
jgi:hypothetical protein